MKTLFSIIVIILVALAGLYLWYWNPRSEHAGTTSTPSASASASPTGLASSCDIVLRETTTVYSRPSTQAPVFGQATSDDQIIAGGVTADGWVGFDPASAQAPNVGPFRLRWISPDADFQLQGDCDNVPEMPTLPPFTCYTMAQTDIPIRSSKSATASVLATMHFGDYTKVTGVTGTMVSSWAKVDLSDGTLHGTGTGYVSVSDVNYNGRDCQSLPTVQ